MDYLTIPLWLGVQFMWLVFRKPLLDLELRIPPNGFFGFSQKQLDWGEYCGPALSATQDVGGAGNKRDAWAGTQVAGSVGGRRGWEAIPASPPKVPQPRR